MAFTDKKFGKRPARHGAVKLAFRNYFDAADLPKPPRAFGNHTLIKTWGMLANDQYADCVFAGAAHETMLWRAQAGLASSFENADVLADYSVVTGFDMSKPDTDQGTDMQAAASYRLKTGIVDARNERHKIGAYVALAPGDLEQIALAAYLTGAVGIGLRMPDSAEGQFDKSVPWDVTRDYFYSGGHYVSLVGRNHAGNFLCVTWGRLHGMTPAFLAEFMDEGIAYLSLERLKNDVSPEGFDKASLLRDLQKLTSKPTKGHPMAEASKPAVTSVDPDLVTAVVAAIKPVVGKFTFSGVSISSHVSEEQYRQVAQAAAAAVIEYQNAPSI